MKFCVSNISAKKKIERASAFTESDKSGVRFDDLNAYFVEAIKSRDKGYFEAFIRAYEPVLQSRAERFVAHYNLSADDTEDIKQIFLETLWFAFLGYDAADPIPLFAVCEKSGGHAAAGLYPHDQKRLHRADAKRVCRAA